MPLKRQRNEPVKMYRSKRGKMKHTATSMALPVKPPCVSNAIIKSSAEDVTPKIYYEELNEHDDGYMFCSAYFRKQWFPFKSTQPRRIKSIHRIVNPDVTEKCILMYEKQKKKSGQENANWMFRHVPKICKFAHSKTSTHSIQPCDDIQCGACQTVKHGLRSNPYIVGNAKYLSSTPSLAMSVNDTLDVPFHTEPLPSMEHGALPTTTMFVCTAIPGNTLHVGFENRDVHKFVSQCGLPNGYDSVTMHLKHRPTTDANGHTYNHPNEQLVAVYENQAMPVYMITFEYDVFASISYRSQIRRWYLHKSIRVCRRWIHQLAMSPSHTSHVKTLRAGLNICERLESLVYKRSCIWNNANQMSFHWCTIAGVVSKLAISSGLVALDELNVPLHMVPTTYRMPVLQEWTKFHNQCRLRNQLSGMTLKNDMERVTYFISKLQQSITQFELECDFITFKSAFSNNLSVEVLKKHDNVEMIWVRIHMAHKHTSLGYVDVGVPTDYGKRVVELKTLKGILICNRPQPHPGLKPDFEHALIELCIQSRDNRLISFAIQLNKLITSKYSL